MPLISPGKFSYIISLIIFSLFFFSVTAIGWIWITWLYSPPPHLGEELIMQMCFLTFPLEKLFHNSSFFFPQSSSFLWYSFVRTIFEFMGAKSFDTSSLAFVKATFFPSDFSVSPVVGFLFSIFLYTKFFHYTEDFFHVLAHVSIQGGFMWRNKNVNSVCMGIVCHLTGFILGPRVRSCHLCWRLIPLSIRMCKVFTMLVPSLY